MQHLPLAVHAQRMGGGQTMTIWHTGRARHRASSQRRMRELMGVGILIVVGMLTLLRGGHPAAALMTHAGTVAAPPTSFAFQGAADGVQDVTPIPEAALPTCGATITMPLGPSMCVDPVYWIVHGVVGMFNWVINWMIALFAGFLQGLVANDLLFDTPTAVTTQNQAVQTLFTDMQVVADAAFALIILIAGFNLIVGTQVGMRQTEAKELLPRLLLGAAGANLAFWLISQAVDGTNTFMHAVAVAPFAFFVPNLSNLPPGTNVLFIGFFGALGIIVYLVLFLFLVFQIFTRLALLDFLIIISPLASVCWILPQTRRAAEWWLGLLCATLILQPLQLLMVAMGMSLVANLPANAGLWGIATVLIQIGLLIATFYLAIRLPALLNYGLFRTVGGVGNPLGMAFDLATAVAGLALAGVAGGAGAAAAGGATPTAQGGENAGAVGGGGAPTPFLGGGGGGAEPPGLPPPGAGSEEDHQPHSSSPAGAGPSGQRYHDDTERSAQGASGSTMAGSDPRPGAGTVIDTTGFAIADDGGPL